MLRMKVLTRFKHVRTCLPCKVHGCFGRSVKENRGERRGGGCGGAGGSVKGHLRGYHTARNRYYRGRPYQEGHT